MATRKRSSAAFETLFKRHRKRYGKRAILLYHAEGLATAYREDAKAVGDALGIPLSRAHTGTTRMVNRVSFPVCVLSRNIARLERLYPQRRCVVIYEPIDVALKRSGHNEGGSRLKPEDLTPEELDQRRLSIQENWADAKRYPPPAAYEFDTVRFDEQAGAFVSC